MGMAMATEMDMATGRGREGLAKGVTEMEMVAMGREQGSSWLHCSR